MDQTLVQIINEWLAVQVVAQRLEQENAQLRADLEHLHQNGRPAKEKAEVKDGAH